MKKGGRRHTKLETKFLDYLDRAGDIAVYKCDLAICDCLVPDRPDWFSIGAVGSDAGGLSAARTAGTCDRCLHRPL